MALAPDLLEILRCPEDRTPLREAEPALIAELNAKVQSGALRNKGGEPVKEPLQGGLIRQDGKVLYPVRDDIPVMLIEEGIPLS